MDPRSKVKCKFFEYYGSCKKGDKCPYFHQGELVPTPIMTPVRSDISSPGKSPSKKGKKLPSFKHQGSYTGMSASDMLYDDDYYDEDFDILGFEGEGEEEEELPKRLENKQSSLTK
jgi:hypothetical protein